MTLRTTRSTVNFTAPFTLKALAGPQPAGLYDVETEEEIVEGNARTVYIRIATLLYVRSPGMTRTVTIDPDDLRRALAEDDAAGRDASILP